MCIFEKIDKLRQILHFFAKTVKSNGSSEEENVIDDVAHKYIQTFGGDLAYVK